MKKIDLKELISLDLKALIERLGKEKKELADLYIDKNMNKLKNTRSFVAKRKQVARIMTIMNQRKMLERLEFQAEGSQDKVTEKVLKDKVERKSSSKPKTTENKGGKK